MGMFICHRKNIEDTFSKANSGSGIQQKAAKWNQGGTRVKPSKK
jgi:hypothetical protein